MECEKIEEKTKEKLKRIYESLNLIEIKKKLTELEDKLFEMVRRKKLKKKKFLFRILDKATGRCKNHCQIRDWRNYKNLSNFKRVKKLKNVSS